MMMVYAMFCARTRTHRRYHRAPPLPINLRTHTHINPHTTYTQDAGAGGGVAAVAGGAFQALPALVRLA